MENLSPTPIGDTRASEEILARIHALEKTLEGAQKTATQFSKDDQALRIYLNVINARIQELRWVVKASNLYIVKHNYHEQRTN